MRTNHKNKAAGILVFMLVGSILGCKKFVEISPPNTLVVTADVFNNNSTATAAMIAIYTQMFNNYDSWAVAECQGLLADELTSYSTVLTQVQFYTNALTAINSNGEWTNGYKYIYEANAMISGLQSTGNISPAVEQQLIGESKFIRAFWYFYLTNEYGDIPLILTTDYSVNGASFRTPSTQVYAQVVRDLIDAKSLLNSNYIDITDTAVTSERVRPTRAAAEALLARVYLYSHKYDSSETQASLVIGNSMYSLCANLSPKSGPNSVFLKNSTEAIWQLSTPLPANANTQDAQYFTLIAAPGSGTFNSISLSTGLLNAFELGDKRKVNWVGSYTTTRSPILTYYYPNKYQAYNTSTISEYTMVLRLAEQYLIRAEARANESDLAGAAADLNVIRNRAGLSNIADSIASSQSSLLAAISHERQVELFTEWGNRWFDLRRTGMIDAVMGNPGNVCQAKGGVWNSNSALYPIPQSEILNDPNLSQNLGY